ncbi:unnamed protein product [Moneuplotes crassus]|uniref:Uncharacterized protein n=1 Tax=Euplotes crassus TaxID=5936 RepID=A0AAD1Y127_EUPCR|nr:unnamed protein product [Moneuplotes crassus]
MNGQNQVSSLQKKLQAREASFDKEKAVLEQKVKLMKIELAEVTEREKSQSKMYELMLSALKSEAESPQNHELLQKLVSSRSDSSSDTKELMEKYSESTVKLEEILNCIKNGQNEDSFLKIIKLKDSHERKINELKRQHKQQLSMIEQSHLKETRKLKDRIKELERKPIIPEVCEIDLSSALTGLNTSSNDYATQRSGILSSKENQRTKDRMTSLEMSGSTTHSKAKDSNRGNFPIKNLKNASKLSAKVDFEEYEKLRRRYEKQKGYIANLKTNVKKYNKDKILLCKKIQSLNLQINSLKHRLNKLVKVDQKVASSKLKHKQASLAARETQNKLEMKNRCLGSRKQSQACQSPKMKKVFSDRNLVGAKVGKTFGRRETLDVNKSGSLLSLGLYEEQANRGFGNNAVVISDEDIRSDYVPNIEANLGPSSTRNKYSKYGNTHRQKGKKMLANGKKCKCADMCQDSQVLRSNYNTTTSQRSQQEFSNSNLCHCGSMRQSMENELMNHVSNAVSSFLSMHEVKGRHARGESKSDIGFTNPEDYGQLECSNEYDNDYNDNHHHIKDLHVTSNMLKDYNGCSKPCDRGSSCHKARKRVCFQTNDHKDQYSIDQNLHHNDLKSEIFSENMIRKNSSKCKSPEALVQRSYSNRGPLVSSHLTGLNKLLKRKVSPIQRDESNQLMTSGHSLFEFCEGKKARNHKRREAYEEDSQVLQPYETLRDATGEKITLTVDEQTMEYQPESSTISEDDQQMDENIEMERIAKMNFYAFKSNEKEGIVAMPQEIKRAKSPKNNQLSIRKESRMNNKYKSFLNKSVNDCANLVISNALLKQQKSSHN